MGTPGKRLQKAAEVERTQTKPVKAHKDTKRAKTATTAKRTQKVVATGEVRQTAVDQFKQKAAEATKKELISSNNIPEFGSLEKHNSMKHFGKAIVRWQTRDPRLFIYVPNSKHGYQGFFRSRGSGRNYDWYGFSGLFKP